MLIVGGILGASILGVVLVGSVFLNSERDQSSVKASVQPSPTLSPESVEAEVERAYLKFWEVWSQANLELKPALLDEVATGEALAALQEQVAAQEDMNQPVRIEVRHSYETLVISPGVAAVEDTYINRSVRLSPKTLEPIESIRDASVRKSHTLRKVDGTWKVAEIIEYR
jgi:hypothetical protein